MGDCESYRPESQCPMCRRKPVKDGSLDANAHHLHDDECPNYLRGTLRTPSLKATAN